MSELSQYFNVIISSPKDAKKQVSVDVTKYIEDGLKYVDEDGLIKELTFDMKEGFLMLDVLAIGMRVDLIGGDLTTSEALFTGQIKTINPDFQETGDVVLKITVTSQEGGKLGVQVRDLLYPMKKHPKAWATKELMYSDIITNLAKDAGIRVNSANIKVKHDIKATLGRGAQRQKNLTDWAFMQFLASKIKCTCWTEERNGISYLYLKDNSSVVAQLSDYTFFFLSRISKSEFIPIQKRSDKMIQFVKASVNLDTRNTTGSYKTSTDPETGKESLTTDRTDDNGDVERWVLDEDKVRKLPDEEQRKLIELFMSGKITWDGEDGTVAAKTYFKKIILSESSREGVPNNTEVKVSGTQPGDDGVNTTNGTTENTGSKSFKTVIDENKLRTLSAEKRSAIMGRIVRGEITDDDKQYYKVVDTTPKEDKDDAKTQVGNKQDTQAGVDKKGKKELGEKADRGKRDAGFNISAKIYGNLAIKPRISYVIEGLGKYSGSYYLYKVTIEFGKEGFVMELIFTK